MICWSLPVIAFLWVLTGEYIISCWKSTLTTVLITSTFFCIIDATIIKYEVRVIKAETRIGIYCPGLSDLPIEDATLWVVLSLIFVFICSAFDKAWTLISTFPGLFQEEVAGVKLSRTIEASFSISYAKIFIRSLLLPSSELPIKYLVVFCDIIAVMKKKSKSFYVASFLLPPKIKQDITTLYAFCRVCDDLVDEASAGEDALNIIKMMSEWLDLLYNSLEDQFKTIDPTLEEARQRGLSENIISFLDAQQARRIDHFLLEKVPAKARPSFLLLSTIVHRISRTPFDELLCGFQWEFKNFKSSANGYNENTIQEKLLVKNENELVHYSRLVAGCIGEMLVWCSWSHEFNAHSCFLKHRKNISKDEIERERLRILSKANNMGVSLQLINIARDIRCDAETLGRVYVPVEWFNERKLPAFKTFDINFEHLAPPSPLHLVDLVNGSKAGSHIYLDNFPYGTYTIRLLDLANFYYEDSIDAIHSLPNSVQRGIRAMIENYHEISAYTVKRDTSNMSKGNIATSDGRRVQVPKWRRIWITLKELYNFS